MTGSMYAAVSGLKAHMSALNVIGNNVSNVNTLGYKTTRYTFNEALYSTQRSGSDGTTIAGGRNPAQVGFGASIGTIDLDMSTKNYSPTGKLLDTMIDGDGFFMVGDKSVGAGRNVLSLAESNGEYEDESYLKGMNLTRLGNFEIDSQGFMVDGNGSVVWGYVERNVSLDTEYKVSAEENATAKKVSEMTRDDVAALKKLGIELHNVKYASEADDAKVISATMTDPELLAPIRMPMNYQTEKLDADGNKTTVNNIQWPTYTAKHYVKQDGTAGTAEDFANGEATEVPATLNDVTSVTVDGTTKLTARLEHDSASINEKSGALTIMTSDGQLLTVGYVAIAKVTNPNGVTHVDGRYYQAQAGAGNVRVTSVKGSVSGTESSGDTKLITGGLESSGTDLATEITNMITVQRGYQANTRIVTVTDSMLEELVNMKR